MAYANVNGISIEISDVLNGGVPKYGNSKGIAKQIIELSVSLLGRTVGLSGRISPEELANKIYTAASSPNYRGYRPAAVNLLEDYAREVLGYTKQVSEEDVPNQPVPLDIIAARESNHFGSHPRGIRS